MIHLVSFLSYLIINAIDVIAYTDET